MRRKNYEISKNNIISCITFVEFFVNSFLLNNPTRDFSKETARTSQDWVKDAVIYEIFPRQYSNKGDFNSITNDLDRLKNWA